MAVSVTVTPGKQFATDEPVTYAKLNLLGQPTFSLAGTIETADLADGAVTAVKAVAGPFWYATGVGDTGVYDINLVNAPAAYAEGMLVRFRADSDNAGATDININGLGDKNLYREQSKELRPGDIRSGMIVEAIYDATGAFQVLSPLADYAAWHSTSVTGTDTIAVTMSPTLKSYYEGLVISFEAAGDNPGACTVNVDGLGAKAIYKNLDVVLGAGDIREGQVVRAIFSVDQDAFQMTSQLGNPRPELAAIVGSSRGLVVRSSSTFPGTHIDVFAFSGQVILQELGGTSIIGVAGFSFTVNVTTNGVNGLEGVDSLLDNTWYYLWVIYNGTTVAGLLSASASSPVLPAGYRYAAMISPIRSTTGGNTYQFYQVERKVWLPNNAILFDRAGSVSWVAISANSAEHDLLKAAVPPIAKTCFGHCGSSVSAARNFAIAGQVTGGLYGFTINVQAPGTSTSSLFTAGLFDVPLITAQDFYYSTTDTAATYRLYVTGYTF